MLSILTISKSMVMHNKVPFRANARNRIYYAPHVYGCNHTGVPVAHYSGNFWWATSAYVQNLPDVIGNGYNDPKFWLFINQPSYCNSFSSGLEGMGHYDHPFPKSVYA